MQSARVLRIVGAGILSGALVLSAQVAWCQMGGGGFGGGGNSFGGGGGNSVVGRGLSDIVSSPLSRGLVGPGYRRDCPWPPRPMDECISHKDPGEAREEMMKALGQEPSSVYVDPEPREPQPIAVSQDARGNIERIENRTNDEIPLDNGWVLGPRALLAFPEGKPQLLRGYLKRDGVKYDTTAALAATAPSDAKARDKWLRGLARLEEPRPSPWLAREQRRAAQQRLQEAGLDPGPLDGVLGLRTQAALRQYQATHGLPSTGVLDEATQRVLRLVPPPAGVGLPAPPQTTRDSAGDVQGEQCVNANVIAACQGYVRAYPNGRFATRAWEKLADEATRRRDLAPTQQLRYQGQ